MIATARVNLRGRPTWDPAALTVQAFHWPTNAPTVRLGEITRAVTNLGSTVEAGAQVITPAGLDERSGGVRRRSQRYQGLVFQVSRDLEPDDLLFAPSPEAPVLLVAEHLRGALVSSRFTALRTTNIATPLWIWAVLNSQSGRDLRQRSASGSLEAGAAKFRILDVAIPVPSMAHQREIESLLRSIELSTHIEEEEAPSTWWRTTDLRVNDWNRQLAVANPDRLESGLPLTTYAETIELGRTRPGDTTKTPHSGMPVVDGAALSGRPISRWLSGSRQFSVIAEPGDVLVAVIGNRARATAVSETAVVDRSVIRIRLKNPSRAEAVADYLNGSAGYAFRQMFIRGATIPRLSVRDLGDIPIPHQVFAASDTVPSTLPLALRLENALWQS